MDIRVEKLIKRFGDKTVLNGFSACFPKGGITCIMGSSGCGKTTLLHILMGLLPADGGSVEGVPEKICAMFQEDRLLEDFSLLRNLRFVLGKGADTKTILAHLGALGLKGEAHTPVKELSGGMKRRGALARAALYDGALLVLDEPFKGLDPATKTLAMDYLLENRRGRTLIAVTHDQEEAAYLGGGLIRMEQL